VALARAGLTDEEEFLASFAQSISGFIGNPASRRISPEEASWTVWDGPYLAGPISYYQQGEILGLLMDLQIRGETKNQKSLDDAMRLLYQRYSGPAGFQSEDVVTTIRDATGVDLHAFFLKHVSGAREIEWEKYFRWMGCVGKASRRPRSAVSFTVAQGGTEGVTVKVPEDSALFRMGLRDGDVVTSVNSVAITSARDLVDTLRNIEIGAQAAIGGKRGTEPISLNGAMEAATDLAEVSFRRGNRLLVQRLTDDSPLAESGLRDGDVVTAIDGVAVKTREDWRAAVAKIREGQKVKISVDRGGSEEMINHTATQAVVVSFSLAPDPAATPLELEIRNAIIHGPPEPAAAASETRPVRKAG
jgi:predicted metalloprotease with PDZ domain